MLAWLKRHPLQRSSGLAIFIAGWFSLLCH